MRYLAALPALALLALGSPAHASSMPVGPTTLTLTRTVENAVGHPTRTVTLHCDPPSGTHPRATAACDALIEAYGDFSRLAPTPGPCTLEYSPVRITAAGTWRGAAVTHHETFANACAASQIAVFAF